MAAGSSPLTRGKRSIWGDGRAASGLIPAHAGKTCASTSWECPARAHPRSRGENNDVGVALAARFGSSPLTRGKPVDVADRLDKGGLIPAHAGKTRP